jgi:O-antigen ligase
LVFTLVIALPYLMLQGIRRKRFILIAFSSALLIITAIAVTPAFRDRYLTELTDDFSARTSQTVEPRIVRWEIAAGLIGKAPLIGHGAGSEIPLLQVKYFEKKFYTSYLHRLNAHNEYMSFLLKSGIWGLAVFLATLFYGFRIAIRKKDVVFFGFMTLLAVVSLSENILDVDKGVMFYSFFFPFFVFIAEQKESLSIPTKRHKNLRKMATNRMADPSLV